MNAGEDSLVLNFLIGDADQNTATNRGGNDRLVSGRNATDHMYGDWTSEALGVGGSDSFVFKRGFGNDFVYDFRPSDHDHLVFDVPGVRRIGDLDVSIVGGDTVITVSADDSVTLVGFTGVLKTADFLFE